MTRPAKPLTRADARAVPADLVSHRSAVLIAAAVLACEGGMGPVRYGDLVMVAFELFPLKFALMDHPDQPDSSAVSSKMVGADGLVARNLLEVSPSHARTWLPTPALVAKARALLASLTFPAAPTAPAAALPAREAPTQLAPRAVAPARPVVRPAPRPPAPLLPELAAALRRAQPWPLSGGR